MFFTLKLLKLFGKLVLLPFRVVAKLLRFLVGFATGRAQGNASVGSSFGHDDESRDGPDPIRDPERENETPTDEQPQRTGADAASTAASDDRLLSPTQYAGVLGVLAFGQLLGLLAYEANVDAVAGAIADVRFVAGTPLFDVLYWGVLDPGSEWLYGVVAVAYGGFYAWLGWRAFDEGAVPSNLARPATGIFAANAVTYAVTPLLVVNEIPFFDDYVAYYTSGGTLLQVVVYAALMGLLYVSTQRLAGRPTTPPVSSGDTAGGAEPAPWAQDDGPATDETPTASDDGEDSTALDESVTADTQGGQSVDEAAADSQPAAGASAASAESGESGTADSPESEAVTEQSPAADGEAVTEQSPAADGEPADEQSPDADGEPATATAGGAAAAGATEATAEADDADQTADVEDDAPEAVEATNEAEAALGRLAGDDADSRLEAAGDLQALAADGHDYLTGERLGDALDDEPDSDVRAALVDALAELETDAATEALRDARFDPNPAVSDRAAEHLD